MSEVKSFDVTRCICSDDIDDDTPEVHIYHELRMRFRAGKHVSYQINGKTVAADVYRDALATLAAGRGQRV